MAPKLLLPFSVPGSAGAGRSAGRSRPRGCCRTGEGRCQAAGPQSREAERLARAPTAEQPRSYEGGHAVGRSHPLSAAGVAAGRRAQLARKSARPPRGDALRGDRLTGDPAGAAASRGPAGRRPGPRGRLGRQAAAERRQWPGPPVRGGPGWAGPGGARVLPRSSVSCVFRSGLAFRLDSLAYGRNEEVRGSAPKPFQLCHFQEGGSD